MNRPKEFDEKTMFGFVHTGDNRRCVAGHKRLFGQTGGSGLLIYTYNQINPDWALHRVWNFGIFALHHIGAGKSTDPAGWYITRARLTAKKIHQGFSVQWKWADTFKVKG